MLADDATIYCNEYNAAELYKSYTIRKNAPDFYLTVNYVVWYWNQPHVSKYELFRWPNKHIHTIR